MPKYIDADTFLQDNAYFADRDFVNTKYEDTLRDLIDGAPAADVEPKQRWIQVTERPPKDNVPVNVVWVNHDPEVYYTDIKDKSFTATAVYFRKRWYWWSATIEDILNEYGDIPQLRMDPGIEITHWSPLPEPPKGEDNA